MKEKLIAMMLISLMIVLPIYTSEVMAVNKLQIIKYSGSSGVQGYIEPYDQIILQINAVVDNDEVISTEQVLVNGFEFDSCIANALGGYDCFYTSPFYTFATGSYNLNIELTGDSGNLLRTEAVKITTDIYPPEISFNRNPVQSGSEVSVDFTVRDRDADATNYNKCSGIKRVEFWDGANKLQEKVLPDLPCVYSDTISFPAPNSNFIIIKAYDNLNQLGTATSGSFILDLSSPEIQEHSLRIESNGASLEDYIRGGEYEADLSILIKEESISPKDVKVDLSGLGGESNVAATICIRQGDSYKCTWSKIPLSFITEKTVTLSFTAVDTFGNTGSLQITRTFKVDPLAPIITKISAGLDQGDKSYLGENPTNITITFIETGSGFTQRHVFLDLSQVSFSYGIRQADVCVKKTTTWECTWINILTSKQHGTSSKVFVVDTTDDVGNLASGLTQKTLFIDKQAPQITNVLITSISEETRTEKYHVSGDDLEISFDVIDDTAIVEVYGDFSNIYNGLGSEKVEAQCQNNRCTLSVGPLASGYRSTFITLVTVDAAGNKGFLEQPITIFGKQDEQNPDYWRVNEIESMPRAIDRQTTPLINQRVYFHIDLQSIAGAEILETKLSGCTGATGFINKQEFINPDSQDPYIMLELKTTTAKEDSIEIKCNLEIVSLYNNQVTNAELEELTLTINFFNMPLGEASAQLQKKIDDTYDTYVDGWWKVVGGLNTLIKYSNTVCRLIFTARNIVQVFQLIGDKWNTVNAVAAATPVGPAANAARVAQCLGTESAASSANNMFKSFDPFCNFVNCRMSRPDADEKGFGAWFKKLGGGGGAPLDEWMNSLGGDFIKKYTGKTPLGSQSWFDSQEHIRSQGYMNSKDSIVMSVLTMCIPGIVYNMNKYREIQCGYLNCLEESTQTGVPIDACEQIKDYQTCKYVVGEVFQIIPFTAFYDHFVGIVRNALSDPLSVVGVGLGAACVQLCQEPTGQAHAVCRWSKIFAEVGDIITNVKGIFSEDAWSVAGGGCQQALDRHEKKDTPAGTEDEDKGGIFG